MRSRTRNVIGAHISSPGLNSHATRASLPVIASFAHRRVRDRLPLSMQPDFAVMPRCFCDLRHPPRSVFHVVSEPRSKVSDVLPWPRLHTATAFAIGSVWEEWPTGLKAVWTLRRDIRAASNLTARRRIASNTSGATLPPNTRLNANRIRLLQYPSALRDSCKTTRVAESSRSTIACCNV
jgi:hypothetical protein